jgi:putative DNA primase/helicase
MRDQLDKSREKYKQKLKEKAKTDQRLLKLKFLELISGKNKKWGKATELLRDYTLKKLRIYTIKDDVKTEMWVYNNGVYVPQGRSEIKLLLRKLLEETYSQFIFNKVVEKIEPDTFIDIDEFFKTRHINEIPLKNGILNVETLELKPFNSNKIFFNKFPVSFDLTATCPKIEKFLKDVLSNEEDIKVFYELAGFGLIKDYSIEKACMMVGDGRNGKGKSIELLKRLVGAENCCSIPLSALIPESFSISELFGKMFNLAGDIGNQDLKDTSMFKSLTGRDLVSGKRKFQNNIHFENYAKFIFACNELPMVYDLTKGFWDRWILLEYPYTFITQEEYNKSIDKTNLKVRNPNIINEIVTPEEMSGFLNQALIGLQRLKIRKDFSSTKGSEEVKKTWIRKSNSFIAFCYDKLEEDYQGKISKKQLRKRYSKFCKKNKIAPKSDYVIKRVLQDTYGVIEERSQVIGDNYDWFWVGVKWKEKIEEK